jgi:hypothetical protein
MHAPSQTVFAAHGEVDVLAADNHVVLAVLEETSAGPDRVREKSVALKLTRREAKELRRVLGELLRDQPNSTRRWSETALAAMAQEARA